MIVQEREKRKVVYINGTKVRADEFAWEGCHKIYVVTDQASRDQLVEYGYTFYPIAELQEVWDSSCGLRFISDASLNQEYVEQGYGEPTEWWCGNCDDDEYDGCEGCAELREWKEVEIRV